MNYTAEQKQAWEKVSSIMKENMIPYVYDTWIAPLRLQAVTEDAVVLCAESFVHRDTVKQRYYTNLYNMIERCFGQSYELKICTPEEVE